MGLSERFYRAVNATQKGIAALALAPFFAAAAVGDGIAVAWHMLAGTRRLKERGLSHGSIVGGGADPMAPSAKFLSVMGLMAVVPLGTPALGLSIMGLCLGEFSYAAQITGGSLAAIWLYSAGVHRIDSLVRTAQHDRKLKLIAPRYRPVLT